MEQAGKMRAFLTEFIIMILFFSIAAVITLQLFLNADQKSAKSVQATEAIVKLQNIAEQIKADGSDIEHLFSVENGWEDNIRYYDERWESCEKELASYQIEALILQEQKEQGMWLAVELIASSRERKKDGRYAAGREILRIEVHNYLPDWGAE